MKNKNNQLSQYTPKASRSKHNKQNNSCLISGIIGFVIFFACQALLSLLGSLIISKNSDPNNLIPFVSTISMTVSSIIGGLVAAKKANAAPFRVSLSFLATVTLTVLVASVVNMKYRENTPLWQSMLLKLPVILGGIFGTFIGSVNKKPKSLYSKYK